MSRHYKFGIVDDITKYNRDAKFKDINKKLGITLADSTSSWTILTFPNDTCVILLNTCALLIIPSTKKLTLAERHDSRYLYYKGLEKISAMKKKYTDEPKYSVLFDAYKQLVRSLFPDDIYVTKFQAREIFRRNNISVPKFSKNVFVRGYMLDNYVKPGGPNVTNVSVDFERADTLCKGSIGINYMNLNTVPLKHKDDEAILLVLGYEETTNKLLGIRVVRLNFTDKTVKGLFACSAGMGTIIQNITEEILRNTLRINFEAKVGEVVRDSIGRITTLRDRFPNEKQNGRDLLMTFDALHEAVPFWKMLGFNEVNPVINGNEDVAMYKPIDPPRENSVATHAHAHTKKRKPPHPLKSKSTSSSSGNATVTSRAIHNTRNTHKKRR